MRLINSLSIICLICCAATTLSAQKFGGGFKGGMVASEVSGDNLAGPNKLGFYASAFTFLPIGQHAYFQGEVMYIQKGSRSAPNKHNNYFDYRFALQYVEIPLLYVQDMAHFTHINYLSNLLIHGGLSLSILTQHEEIEGGYTLPEPNTYNPAELNLLLGLSYPISESLYFSLGHSETAWNNYGQYNTLWTLGLSYVVW
ncbi:MAG: PorT family protein [Bacteroidales bacterium]|nr:PorT family protein [Bacteroidales bacterium]